MPKGHYFLGVGVSIIRTPNADEINAVMEAGNIINLNRHILLYKKPIIHGAEYRVQDNVRRKFCNYIVFCKQSRYYIIEKILSYRYNGVTIAGFIGIYLLNNGNVYGILYMHHVTETEQKEFIPFSMIISPAFIIKNLRETVVTSLSNVWETD